MCARMHTFENGQPLQCFAAVPSVRLNLSNGHLSMVPLAAPSLVKRQREVYKLALLRLHDSRELTHYSWSQ